jgi:hypothetical protein
MPARRFFVMLKAARKIQSWQFSNLCDIAAIPLGGDKYFDGIKNVYSIANKRRPEVPEPSAGPVVSSASPDAMWAFMAAVNAKKGRH